MRTRNLRIGTKLSLLLSLLVAGTLLAGGYGVASLRQAQHVHASSLETSQQLLSALEAARLAQVAYKAQVQEFKHLLLRGHDQEQYDRYLANFRKAKDQVAAQLATAASTTRELGLPSDGLQELQRLHAGVIQEHMDALKDFRMGDAESALAVDKTLRGKDRVLDEKIEANVAAIKEFAATEATRLREEAEVSTRRATLFFAALVGVLTVLAVAAGTLTLRRLLRQLGGEPDHARQVAERIAAGDLTVRVDARRSAPGSVLAAMDAMGGNLRRLVGQVAEGAEAVARSSDQIAQGHLDLSQRTEEQASTLEETAAQMEEITGTVAQNADHARRASALAGQASEVAQRGGEVVGEVVSTMDAITESSRRISEIVGVIDGIAFQTNILALNAAVEAARAGEQGRGFAVVAAEVRNLAQRSATAAREVKSLIAESVGRVETGARLVGTAGRTTEEIVAAVRQVRDLITEIAAASEEQSAGIEQVNRAVTQMEQVVQQNAALVEEATAATGSMKAQAAALTEMVAAFRLGEPVHAAPADDEPALPAMPPTAGVLTFMQGAASAR